MKKCYGQHGDVLIMVDIENDKVKKINVKDGYVVERGEGVHTHVLEKTENCDIFVGKNGELKIKVKDCIEENRTRINHEEHKTKILDPGNYEKLIEADYDVEADEERNVID